MLRSMEKRGEVRREGGGEEWRKGRSEGWSEGWGEVTLASRIYDRTAFQLVTTHLDLCSSPYCISSTKSLQTVASLLLTNPPSPPGNTKAEKEGRRNSAPSTSSTSTNSPNLSLLNLLTTTSGDGGKSAGTGGGNTGGRHGLTSGLRSWKVVRRYSDFVNFDYQIGTYFGQHNRNMDTMTYAGVLAALPPLPPKSFWGRLNPDFLNIRTGSLQDYLNSLCGTSLEVHRCQVVRGFLGVKEMLGKNSRQNMGSQNSLRGLEGGEGGSKESLGDFGGRGEEEKGGTGEDGKVRRKVMERRLRDVVEECERDMIWTGGLTRSGVWGTGGNEKERREEGKWGVLGEGEFRGWKGCQEEVYQLFREGGEEDIVVSLDDL